MAGSFATKFSAWCPFRAEIEPYTGSNDYGVSTYGAKVSDIPCMIEERIRLVRDLAGNERASNTTLYLLAAGAVDSRSKITMPTEYKGIANPPIITVSNFYDRTGEYSHSEVYL